MREPRTRDPASDVLGFERWIVATRVTDIPIANTAEGLDLDDRELVLAFQAGEIDAYSDIYVKYRRLAAQICYRILENRDDAEEAVQETMLRVYRGLPRFNGRYQLQAWVARIATNVALDQVRARQRRPLSDSPLEPDRETGALNVAPDHEPPDELERLLDREDVRSVLGEIPDHHRDALVLREFEGRSHEEIGDALGVSPAQAKALIHRAKKSFRRAWGEDGERRGIAAFAPILLAVFRLPGLRRLAGSAREVVANASATATQVAVNVTAAPAAVQTSMSVADKVTAAALTVIVAGTATVGAVAIRRAAKPAAKPSPSVAAAPAPSTVPAVVAVVPTKARPVAHHHHAKHHARAAASAGSSTVATAPSATPSTEPSDEPVARMGRRRLRLRRRPPPRGRDRSTCRRDSNVTHLSARRRAGALRAHRGLRHVLRDRDGPAVRTRRREGRRRLRRLRGLRDRDGRQPLLALALHRHARGAVHVRGERERLLRRQGGRRLVHLRALAGQYSVERGPGDPEDGGPPRRADLDPAGVLAGRIALSDGRLHARGLRNSPGRTTLSEPVVSSCRRPMRTTSRRRGWGRKEMGRSNVDSPSASQYILASFPPSRLCRPARGTDKDEKYEQRKG